MLDVPDVQESQIEYDSSAKLGNCANTTGYSFLCNLNTIQDTRSHLVGLVVVNDDGKRPTSGRPSPSRASRTPQLHPRRIRRIDRIIPDIGIAIEIPRPALRKSDRVARQEASDGHKSPSP